MVFLLMLVKHYKFTPILTGRVTIIKPKSKKFKQKTAKMINNSPFLLSESYKTL